MVGKEGVSVSLDISQKLLRIYKKSKQNDLTVTIRRTVILPIATAYIETILPFLV